MEVVPASVRRVSRGWEGQHADLADAARRLGAAPTGGFTGAVAGAAARFTAEWQRHTQALADRSGDGAVTLRGVLAGYLATDETTALTMAGLANRERR